MNDDYDIVTRDGVHHIRLPGSDETIGTLTHPGEHTAWHATASDGTKLGLFRHRTEGAAKVVDFWKRHREGAIPASPTSTVALARELHRARHHSAPVARQVNWLCDCQKHANEFNNTQWLRDVVTVLGGTFPSTTPKAAARG